MEDQTATATAIAETGAQQTATSAPETQNQAQTGAQAAPTESFINPDGTLKPGWQTSNLVPEDFRGRKVYGAVGNDVASLLKHIGNQDIAISRQGKGIMIPPPDATKTEREIYNRAISGVETPQGYDAAIKAAIPKGMEEQYNDPEKIGALQTLAFKHGATPAMVADLVAFDAARMQEAKAALEKDPMPFFEEILPLVQPIYKAEMEKVLQSKWGDAYQARKNLFQRAVAENTKEGDERELLLVACEREPLFVDLLATMMNKSFTSGMGPDTSTGSPAGAQNTDQRIDELMRDPNYMDGRTNPPRHKYLVNEVQRLMASKIK
jgi:hypothetical protein